MTVALFLACILAQLAVATVVHNKINEERQYSLGLSGAARGCIGADDAYELITSPIDLSTLRATVQPSVEFELDTAEMYLVVTVRLLYLPLDAVWSIRLNDDTRDARANVRPHNGSICDACWHHAPNALHDDAFRLSANARPPRGSFWTVAASGCSHAQYTARVPYARLADVAEINDLVVDHARAALGTLRVIVTMRGFDAPMERFSYPWQLVVDNQDTVVLVSDGNGNGFGSVRTIVRAVDIQSKLPESAFGGVHLTLQTQSTEGVLVLHGAQRFDRQRAGGADYRSANEIFQNWELHAAYRASFEQARFAGSAIFVAGETQSDGSATDMQVVDVRIYRNSVASTLTQRDATRFDLAVDERRLSETTRCMTARWATDQTGVDLQLVDAWLCVDDRRELSEDPVPRCHGDHGVSHSVMLLSDGKLTDEGVFRNATLETGRARETQTLCFDVTALFDDELGRTLLRSHQRFEAHVKATPHVHFAGSVFAALASDTIRRAPSEAFELVRVEFTQTSRAFCLDAEKVSQWIEVARANGRLQESKAKLFKVYHSAHVFRPIGLLETMAIVGIWMCFAGLVGSIVATFILRMTLDQAHTRLSYANN